MPQHADALSPARGEPGADAARPHAPAVLPSPAAQHAHQHIGAAHHTSPGAQARRTDACGPLGGLPLKTPTPPLCLLTPTLTPRRLPARARSRRGSAPGPPGRPPSCPRS